MKGQRLKTTPTADGLLDVYATTEGDVVRVMAGTRSRPGNWEIDLIGLPTDTGVKVRTFAFQIADGDKFQQIDGPKDLGETEEVVKDDKLRLRMKHQDATTAFAFEVSLSRPI